MNIIIRKCTCRLAMLVEVKPVTFEQPKATSSSYAFVWPLAFGTLIVLMALWGWREGLTRLLLEIGICASLISCAVYGVFLTVLRKEDRYLSMKLCLFGGLLSCALAFVINWFIFNVAERLISNGSVILLLCAFNEEVLKLLSLLALIKLTHVLPLTQKSFRVIIDSPRLLIIAGVSVGFGFSIIENFLYFFVNAASLGTKSQTQQEGVATETLILRNVLLGHEIYTGIAACVVGKDFYIKSKKVSVTVFLKSVLVPGSLHYFHNLSQSLGGAISGYMAWTCILGFYLLGIAILIKGYREVKDT